MNKVDRKWFLDNGFKESVYENTKDYQNHMGEVTKEKTTQYGIYFKDRWARFDIYYRVTTNKFGDKKIGRYYMFYGHNKKTNFEIENRITYYKPTIEQMKAALLVIGIK